MSAGFLQGIRLKADRLKEALVDAGKVELRVELTGNREEILEAIEAKQAEVAAVLQRIRDTLSTIQRDVDRWLDYLKGLSGEAHTAEMKVYTDEVACADSYLHAVDDGDAAYSQLKRNLEQLEAKYTQVYGPTEVSPTGSRSFTPGRVVRPMATRGRPGSFGFTGYGRGGDDRHLNFDSSGGGDGSHGLEDVGDGRRDTRNGGYGHAGGGRGGTTPRTPTRDMGRPRVQVPKIQLPEFSGQVLEFKPFWDTFAATIDSQSFTKMEKLAYLKSVLKGEAAQAVDGYPMTEESYDVIKEVLNERYGNEEFIVHKLYNELDVIPRSGNGVKETRQVFERLEKVIRMLEALGENVEQTHIGVVYERRMPYWVITKIHEKKSGRDDWSIRELRQVVSEAIRFKELVAFMESDNPRNEQRQRGPKQGTQRAGVFAVQSQPEVTVKQGAGSYARSCVYCNEGHYSDQCQKVKSVEARKKQLMTDRRCFVCSGQGHRARDCTGKPCKCGGRHHRSICTTVSTGSSTGASGSSGWGRGNSASGKSARGGFGGKKFKAAAVASTENCEGESGERKVVAATSVTACGQAMRASESFLMTAEVPVGNPDSDQITTAAVFFDPGSDLTMIKDSLAQKLGLSPLREAQMELETVHSGGSSLVRGSAYEVRLHLNDGTARTVEAFSVNTLIGRVKRLKVLGRSATSEGEVEPEILVGVQDFWDFVKGVKNVGQSLKLVDSTVGPMLCGRRLIAAVKAVPSSEEDLALEELSEVVHKAWRIDSIGVTDCPLSKDEEEAVRVFEESVKVNDDGRYETRLLFNTPDPDIPMHKGLCVGRARAVQKRAKAEGRLDEYHEYFMDLIRRKILELAPEVPTGPIEHYVPHHPVYAAAKNGKLRIVFDGGARMSKAEKSLNDRLFKGPDMTADLCGSLFRFRLPEVAVTADIEKAFLQVSIGEEERDALRVIWARNPHEPISESNMVVYRFCRVVFGLRSSPFLLNGVVKVHLKRMADKYPTASEVLDSVYVDNIFLGGETGAEALRKCAELKELFAEANMPVREYLSNSRQVMKQFADDPNQEVARVLGVQWDLRRDVLFVKVQPKDVTRVGGVTKRNVLKTMMSVFDPLGLVAPCMLKAKVFFQQLCADKRGWDEPLSEREVERWQEITDEWDGTTVELPRRAFPTKPIGQPTLHVLGDASSLGYACCVFLRVETNDGVKLVFLFGKSRVKPLKGMTMPQSELMGSLIGARAARFVMKELRQTFEWYLWSDSATVVRWLNNPDKARGRFVDNRVREIVGIGPKEVRYVPYFRTDNDGVLQAMAVKESAERIVSTISPMWTYASRDGEPGLFRVEVVEWDDGRMLATHKVGKRAVPRRWGIYELKIRRSDCEAWENRARAHVGGRTMATSAHQRQQKHGGFGPPMGMFAESGQGGGEVVAMQQQQAASGTGAPPGVDQVLWNRWLSEQESKGVPKQASGKGGKKGKGKGQPELDGSGGAKIRGEAKAAAKKVTADVESQTAGLCDCVGGKAEIYATYAHFKRATEGGRIKRRRQNSGTASEHSVLLKTAPHNPEKPEADDQDMDDVEDADGKDEALSEGGDDREKPKEAGAQEALLSKNEELMQHLQSEFHCGTGTREPGIGSGIGGGLKGMGVASRLKGMGVASPELVCGKSKKAEVQTLGSSSNVSGAESHGTVTGPASCSIQWNAPNGRFSPPLECRRRSKDRKL